MIRWFVRRVVKYILEELSGSKEFGAILDRLSSGGSGNRYLDVGTAHVAGTVKTEPGPRLESDSMARLAGAVVQRSEGVKLSGMTVSEKSAEGGKVNQAAIDRLSNLGE